MFRKLGRPEGRTGRIPTDPEVSWLEAHKSLMKWK